MNHSSPVLPALLSDTAYNVDEVRVYAAVVVVVVIVEKQKSVVGSAWKFPPQMYFSVPSCVFRQSGLRLVSAVVVSSLREMRCPPLRRAFLDDTLVKSSTGVFQQVEHVVEAAFVPRIRDARRRCELGAVRRHHRHLQSTQVIRKDALQHRAGCISTFCLASCLQSSPPQASAASRTASRFLASMQTM